MKTYKYDNNNVRRTELTLSKLSPRDFVQLSAEVYATTANANPEPNHQIIYIPRATAIELALDILKMYGEDIPYLMEAKA